MLRKQRNITGGIRQDMECSTALCIMYTTNLITFLLCRIVVMYIDHCLSRLITGDQNFQNMLAQYLIVIVCVCVY